MNTINSMTKLFAFTIVLAIVLLAATSHVYAAKSKKNRIKPEQSKLWQQVEESSLQPNTQRASSPGKIPVYSLNRRMLKDILDSAPLEFTNSARQTEVILEIPTPEGKFARFRIVESPVLSREVAAKFPTWKTFSGQGIDDKTATARFDTNDNGFHGYVSSPNELF